jgi:hypothetical protein
MNGDLALAPADAKRSQFEIDREAVKRAMFAANLPIAAAKMDDDSEIAARWIAAFRGFVSQVQA